jgi:hypothetical protein
MLFYLGCILLVLELFIMSFLKISMFTLTTYLHCFYVLLVGLNNKNSIYYLIAHVLLSVIFDIAFVVLMFINKIWLPLQISTTYNSYWLLFFAFLIIAIVMRIIFVVILVPFRNAYEANNNDSFTVLGQTFFFQPIKGSFNNQP